ncbi:MAG: copper homeostasis membrane protein CopD [Methylobacterium mesophilicum]|nr:copper homeostasis membrane protein CopD [Methylobacterium mesophilicum]
MTDPANVIVATRFAFDAAALFLWGAGFFLWLLVPLEWGMTVWRRLRPGRMLALAGLMLATAAALPARTAMLGDGWSSILDGALVQALLGSTNIGTAWLVQAAAAAALAAAVLAGRDTPAVTALCAALLLASTVLTGHAATYDGWLGIVHQAGTVTHLWSAGAWVGALVPVLVILPLATDPHGEATAGRALIRFSNMGHVAVALAVVSGMANTLLIVGGLPTDTRSTYQMLLLVKMAVVAAMVGLAVVNRYVLVPRLGRWMGAPQALVAGTLAELVLATIAIGLVAWFGTLQPAQ